MDIEPTMAKWPWGVVINFVSIFSQNRFWVMKLYFLGKVRWKKFLTQIWFFGSFLPPTGVNFLTKIIQNRFWVMKICFLGKNRRKKFLKQIWFFGSFLPPPRVFHPPRGGGGGGEKMTQKPKFVSKIFST